MLHLSRFLLVRSPWRVWLLVYGSGLLVQLLSLGGWSWKGWHWKMWGWMGTSFSPWSLRASLHGFSTGTLWGFSLSTTAWQAAHRAAKASRTRVQARKAEALSPHSFSYKQVTSQQDSRWGECHSHIVEEDASWDMLSQSTLENKICHMCQ